jgi:hypothetical protein
VQRLPPWLVVSPRLGRSGRGRRDLVQLLLAGVANALTVAILLSELAGPATSRPAGGRAPSGAATTTSGVGGGGRPPTPPGAASNLLEDPSFEAGLGRWRASDGARLARVSGGRSGSWTASLGPGTSTRPSMAVRDVRRCQTGKAYAVSVWVRASRSGTLVRVDLVEESHGRRFAVDTAGAVLGGQRWEPLEVIHVTHRSGAALSIELAAVDLPADVTVLVDDLELRVTRASSKP